MENESDLKTKKSDMIIASALVLALVAGIGIGLLVLGKPAEKAQQAPGLAQLGIEDKNFLVTLANSQAVLSAQLSNTIDWCTSSGGVWHVSQQQGTLDVTQGQALQLQQLGADVRQEGERWIANVAVMKRDSCLFPLRKAG